jgi:DTW domain-containing protein YfiP
MPAWPRWLDEMRSRTPRDFSGVCPRCFLKIGSCLCAELPRIDSSIEFVIVRHIKEDWLTSNTARLAALILTKARIVKYGNEEPFDDSLLCGDGTWLLYPGSHQTPTQPLPRRFVVLDGTFRQARRMYKRISALRALPELALSAPSHQPHRLRNPPRVDGLSTIEAIAMVLGRFESPDIAAQLLAAHAEFVRRADATRGRQRLHLTDDSV